ncbi:MAG: aldo/keto reductase [Muribaculaceae bacterium]|nr:aldo/keto reductase [Muribaculaceae bacterium]
MSKNDNHNMSRRHFLKVAGGTAVASSAVLAACTTSKDDDSNAISAADVPKDKMTYRTNNNTGDRVSILGYGMMRLPVEGDFSGRENPDAPIDQELVNKEVDFAIEHGVNYFDTSPAYCQGRSETATGIALSRHPRDKYFIATKLSNFDPSTWPLEESQKMFHNSLKELKVDYIDYLLLHSVGGGKDAIEEFNGRFMDNGLLDWLVEQKEAGKIRNLGFSYHGDIAVFDNLLAWHDSGDYHWDFVQIELNYLDWKHAKEINERNTNAEYLYAELKKRNIPAVIMEPLLGGRLANVPDAIVADMKRRDPKSSVASWAFRYAGTPDGVLTVLSGMTYMDHLMENIKTYSPLRPITPEENAFLETIADKLVALQTIPCNDCKYCMPCPYGINIPAIFVHYNKCIKEGNLVRNEQDNAYKRARRAFLVGYDRSVPKLRQAQMCIGCGQCEGHCPQRIRIPQELAKIDEFVEKLKRSDRKD